MGCRRSAGVGNQLGEDGAGGRQEDKSNQERNSSLVRRVGHCAVSGRPGGKVPEQGGENQ